MHQIEIVRLSALWDQAHIDNETIQSVIELIDDKDVIDALANAARAQYAGLPEPADKNELVEEREITVRLMKKVNNERGEEHAQNAIDGLRKAIVDARSMRASEQLKSIRNLRNKHVAHYLTQSNAEKNGEIIVPMKVGDERLVPETSLKIIQTLYCWVNGIGISFDELQKIDKKCAEALWGTCTFAIKN